jgi:pimeloyl-ACP methyl ester carboxylesterase
MRVERDGVSLYYETEGSGDTVAFVADAGYGAWSWAWQHGAVAGPHESLVWDLRGTGRSDRPPGPYDVDDLAADLDAVLADAGARTAHLVGLGLGGMVALRHARRYGRAASLVLVGTAASGGAVGPGYETATAPDGDLAAALSAAFRESHPDVVVGIEEWRDGDADRTGWVAQRAALDGFEAGPLYEVDQPALVVHGGADRAVPAAAGRELADGLPRGEFEAYPDAGHLVCVERSQPVNDRLLGFLDRRR